MSSDGSDIELQSTLPKISNKKMPRSPSEDLLEKKQEKKLTTKLMINQALIHLKSRKGVSFYAIKKYISDNYNIDTEKNNYLIKKSIKSGVEDGSIVQVKGIGATGSFKLVPIKEKKSKPKKVPKEKKETKEKTEKKKSKEKSKKTAEKSIKSKTKSKELEEKKGEKPKKKILKEKAPKEKKDGGEKVKKVKIAKSMQTPSKKKAMMKRKSIGSIIKKPKMKPKAKA